MDVGKSLSADTRKITTFPQECSALRSVLPNCASTQLARNRNFLCITLYVNDLLVASSSTVELLRVRNELSSHYEMKTLRLAESSLALELCVIALGTLFFIPVYFY